MKVDPSEWAGELEAWAARLEKAQKDVAREAREAQAALDLKNRAMTANDDTFMRVARFLSAAFFLVGDDDLATKVRPSARRPGTVLAETEGDVNDAAPAPDDEPTPPADK